LGLPPTTITSLSEKLAHLSSDERKIIVPVLTKCAGIFHDNEDNGYKSTNVVVHKIKTGDATPIKKAPYKTPFALRLEINWQGCNKSILSTTWSRDGFTKRGRFKSHNFA
jgi:hypothetical protein